MEYGRLGQKYTGGGRSDPYQRVSGYEESYKGDKGSWGKDKGWGKGSNSWSGDHGKGGWGKDSYGSKGGETCEFFAKSGWCKYGDACRYIHGGPPPGKGKGGPPLGKGGQIQEACEFFAKAGWCKYGESCRYQHVRNPDTPVGGPPPAEKTGETCQFFVKAGWCKYGDNCRHEHIPGPDTPAPPENAGEPCKFFQKAGWCQFGDGCRYQHIPGPDTPLAAGKGGNPSEPCEFFSKAGWCKYENSCRFAHIARPQQEVVKSSPPMTGAEYEKAAKALIATPGMQKAEGVGVALSDEAVKALLTLPSAIASELLEAVAEKHATLRDPSNYVISTIARGYMPRAS